MKFSNLITPRGDWIATYPTTNARIIVGIRLAVGYVVYNCTLMALGAYYHFDVYSWVVELNYATAVFIAAMLAISLGQFWAKRATADASMQPTRSEVVTGEPSSPKVAPRDAYGPRTFSGDLMSRDVPQSFPGELDRELTTRPSGMVPGIHRSPDATKTHEAYTDDNRTDDA